MRLAGTQSVLYAWFMVLLDHYWRGLLLLMLVLFLFSGLSMAATSTVESTDTEVTGELSLSLEPSEQGGTDFGATLPGDGVLPMNAGDTLDITASYVSAPGSENRTFELTIDRTLKREVRDGTLWRVDSRLATGRDTGSIAVTGLVNVSQQFSIAANIDNRFNTTSGSVEIEIRAWLSNASDRIYPAAVGTTIQPSHDHLRYEAEVSEPVLGETKRAQQSPGWALLAVISLGITSGIVGLRWGGVLPLSPSARRRYRFAVVTWRYGHLVVTSNRRIDTANATRMDDLSSLVKLAQRGHRPMHVDRRGLAAVSIDSHTYWWSVTPAFKSDTE